MSEPTQADRELAIAGLRKRREGQRPIAAEAAAIRRVEAARAEEQRWAAYRSIPKKHWERMSGRQAKVINDQGRRYGLPLEGPVIDLEKLARALHDFLAANAAALQQAADGRTVDAEIAAARRRKESAGAAIEELRLGQLAGRLIERKTAEAERLELLRLFVSVMETAGSELAVSLAGLAPAEVRRAVEAYFDDVRRRLADGQPVEPQRRQGTKRKK